MASRNLDDSRNVIEAVQKAPNQVLDQVAEFSETVIKHSQEAKIAENTAKAQLDLNKLDFDFQNNYADNPAAGEEKFKAARKQVFDAYGKDISPFFKESWNNNVREMTNRNDASNQAWALKQTRVNTVKSVNNTLQTNFQMANMDGQRFGADGGAINPIINYQASKENLHSFAKENLGEETTNDLMGSYDKDYTKSFIIGAAATNPTKAHALLERDDVKNMFDPEEIQGIGHAIDRSAKVLKQNQLGTQMTNETGVVELVNDPNADYQQTMLQIDEAEFNNKISYKSAQQARRVLNSRKAIDATTSTPAYADMINRIHDTADDKDNTAYMEHVSGIRAEIMQKQASGELRYSDVRKLNSELAKISTARVSGDDDGNAGAGFRDGKQKIEMSLPKEYHDEAVARVFTKAQADPLMSRPKYNAITNQVIDDINVDRRQKAVTKLQNVTASDDDFLKSINATPDDVRETAQQYGLSEAQVIAHLKAQK